MPNLAQIQARLRRSIGQAVSVVVADTANANPPVLTKLSLARDAADRFRDLCRLAVDGLDEVVVVEYSPDAELARTEVFVLDDPASLDELTDFRTLATTASTLRPVSPRDLEATVAFYAVVAGDDDRAVFVRRVDPQIGFKSGGFLAVARQQLTHLEDPVFRFAPGFDLILTDAWAVVLNQNAFERLFRELGLIERNIAEWTKGITDHLAMSPDSLSQFQQAAVGDSRMWRKLREIRRRGHLAGVEIHHVRDYARSMGLDPATIIEGDQLTFTKGQRFSFLHLLNEDLYRGALTDEPFEAQRKTAAD